MGGDPKINAVPKILAKIAKQHLQVVKRCFGSILTYVFMQSLPWSSKRIKNKFAEMVWFVWSLFWRDHSKWCDDEIITRIDCKGALSLRSSKSHADHQSGVSFELITTPGTLVTMQIQGVYDVVVYFRESKGGKHILLLRCCISKWYLFFRKETTPDRPI